ncbi:hypothetical protein ACHAQD_011009 [Fusarium lateritium]
MPESVQWENRDIAPIEENHQKGEAANKIPIETVGHQSNSMFSASDSLETENGSFPTAPHSNVSSSSPIEPDMTHGDAVEVCSLPGEFPEASSIEVVPNNHGGRGFLEWEVEKIIGEEMIEDETYYLVKWGTSQVKADDAQGMSDLIEEWERRNTSTQDQEEYDQEEYDQEEYDQEEYDQEEYDQEEYDMTEDDDFTSRSSQNGLEVISIIGTLPSSDDDQSSFEWEVKRIVGEDIDQEGRYYRVDWKETLVRAKDMRKMSDLIGAWEERKAAIEEEEAEELGHRPKRGHGDSMARNKMGRAPNKRQKKGLR